MKRSFNRSEKNRLFFLADGKCQMCGDDLGPGWHADHIIPYSAGGKTAIENGQALCQKCNLIKGSKMINEITPRQHQSEAINIALAKVMENDTRHAITFDLFPGLGKSLIVPFISTALSKNGLADFCLHFSPRRALATQMELGWQSDRLKYTESGKIGPIVAIDNIPYFNKAINQFGITATFNNARINEAHYVRHLKDRKGILFIDEAQFAGGDGDGFQNKINETLEVLHDYAVCTIVLTGTPDRAGTNERMLPNICNWQYDENTSIWTLKKDLELDYTYGVSKMFLREFSFEYYGGEVNLFEKITGNRYDIDLSEYESGLTKVMMKPEVWHRLCDQGINKLRAIRTPGGKFSKLKMLVTACNQRHANLINKYLSNRYPEFKTVVAHSNESKAEDTLRRFRSEIDYADILVTVQMAYIGFDCKQLSVLVDVGNIRWRGFQIQKFMRCGRVWSDIPYHQQHLYAIVPNDPKMQELVNEFREKSETAVKQRDKDIWCRGGYNPEIDEEMERESKYEVVGARIDSVDYTKGINSQYDVLPTEQAKIKELQDKGLSHIPAHILKLIVTETNGSLAQQSPVVLEKPPMMEREKRAIVSNCLASMLRRMGFVYYGESDERSKWVFPKELKTQFGDVGLPGVTDNWRQEYFNRFNAIIRMCEDKGMSHLIEDFSNQWEDIQNEIR